MASKDAKDLRDKDGEKDKKRRRIIKMGEKSERAISPVVETRKVMIKADGKKAATAKNVHSTEEAEVESREPEDDVAIQKRACDEVRRMMVEISELKEQGQGHSAEVEEKRIQGTLQFVTLKKMNRLAHIRCKKAREATNEAKQQIDQRHLQLQNLLYEVSHLQKEINKCLQFQSKDEDIKLISVPDFYKEAPDDVTRPEVTRKDLHAQMLARLDWELAERKRLTSVMEGTMKKRGKIAQDMQSKQEYLDTLQPKLSTILQSTKPVQEYLGLNFDEKKEQHEMATFLPRPLYVLYRQATAFKEACDPDLNVMIEGDIEMAKSLGDFMGPDLDEDSDGDEDTEETEKLSKKRRRRISQDRKTLRRQKILRAHPLTVTMAIKCSDGSSLHLVYHYLLNLSIVTVKVKLTPATGPVATSVSGGDLLSPTSLLSCLFPDDLGNSTPNSANEYYLARMGLGCFADCVADTGQAYLWVQSICGLQFLKTSSETPEINVVRPCVDPALSSSHMETTISRLRRRVAARLALQKQLSMLERCNVSVNPDSQKCFPAKISSRLSSWKRYTFTDFESLPFASDVLKCGLARESDLFFTGTVTRGSAKLVFHVAVSPDYPSAAPVFVIDVTWQTQRNCLTDDHIKDMESELNYFYDELVTSSTCDELLMAQVQRLLMCFDVYLETESEMRDTTTEGPAEFAKEKIFTRLAKGPSRKKPYVYNSQVGFFHQRM